MSITYRFFAIMLCVSVLMIMAGTATAQNASTQKPAANTGQNNVKVTHHKDWEVRCPKSDEQGPCEMTQLIKNPDNDKPIMRVLMGYPPQANGQPAMILILPLGTRLTQGVQLSVDGGKTLRFPFQICLKEGCRAAFQVKSSLLHQLKHGQSAKATIVGPKGHQINLKISLLGFTASNKAIAP
jgi:invasion protein IalB